MAHSDGPPRGRRNTGVTRVGDDGGMEPDRRRAGSTPDKELRRDIRRVTSILGETLARTEGDDLLALVEQVRAHAKEDRLDQLPEFDLATITRLVRAFTAYFHLANITEQVHRGRALIRASAEEGGWLERAVARIAEADVDPDEVASLLQQIAVRPVFTAHPDRGRPAFDDRQAAPGRRAARGAGQPAADPPAGGGCGAALAHRRDPDRAAGADRRGSQCRLLPRGPLRRRAARRARGAARPAGPAGGGPAPGRAPAPLRLLGGRRPRRQPACHAGDDARGAHPSGGARHPAAAQPGRRVAS